MTIITDQQDGVLIARFQGGRIIGETHIANLGIELNDLLSEQKKIVLNFENVNFMSSAMIGKLIQFGKKAKDSGISLCFCELNENIQEVFDLMKLGTMFKTAKDEDKALKVLSKRGWFG